jgi:hypothetical protein
MVAVAPRLLLYQSGVRFKGVSSAAATLSDPPAAIPLMVYPESTTEGLAEASKIRVGTSAAMHKELPQSDSHAIDSKAAFH